MAENVQPRTPQTSGKAVAALVLGILSIVFAIIEVGAIIGIIGIILGILGLKSPKRHLAIWGLCLSIFGTLFALVLIITATAAIKAALSMG